jgi:hypothetical protein
MMRWIIRSSLKLRLVVVAFAAALITTAHRVVFTVTDLTKVINGVRTVVIFDRDYTDDRLLESELAFYAQDKDGNVWHLEGAMAGIMMKAKSESGGPNYAQGFAPAPFNWTDRARTIEMDQKATVPAGVPVMLPAVMDGSRGCRSAVVSPGHSGAVVTRGAIS